MTHANTNQLSLRIKQLNSSIAASKLSDDDAAYIIEVVLDTLVEVGNGTTDADLHEAADYLFALRDHWFKSRIVGANPDMPKSRPLPGDECDHEWGCDTCPHKS